METFKTTVAQLVSLKKYVFIILPALLIFSCTPEDNVIESIDTTTTLIAKDNLYGAGSEGIVQQNMVITDADSWTNLMNQMNSVNPITDTFYETDIDFSVYQIIAVFDKVKSSSGHSLKLDLIWESDDIMVNITHSSPLDMAPYVMTQPFHIVKILATALPVLFN